MSFRRIVAAIIGGAFVSIGIAIPAVAEGSKTTYMTGWKNGYASNNWYDSNTDSVSTHVTYYDCTNEFTSTIRRTVFSAPDPAIASEWINCKSYADAVYAGDLTAANYHFDISGMPDNCSGRFGCTPTTTTVKKLIIYW